MKTINEIINGKTAITPETSIKLEQALNIPASFWNNLEANYQVSKARKTFNEIINKELKEARSFPLRRMIEYKWIESPSSGESLVSVVQKFFGVTSLANIIERQVLTSSVLYRMSKKGATSKYSLMAWLRKGVIDSQNIQTNEYNEEGLESDLNRIKSLSRKDITIASQELVSALATHGVALVFTKPLPGVPISGASRWLTSSKAIIQVGIRNKFHDIFWFNIFHEIGHILLHSKKGYNIDLENSNNGGSSSENEADTFAADCLIPPQQYARLISDYKKEPNSTRHKVIEYYSENLEVHPGIVEGRLMHDKVISSFSVGRYRRRLDWVS